MARANMNQPDFNGIDFELGNLEGPYFTQWRIDLLLEMLHTVVYAHGDKPLVDVENAKIWYDAEEDFHRMSYDSGGKHIEVRLYKVWSSKVDGKDGWVGCPRSHVSDFARHLRGYSKQKEEPCQA